jgi:diguanylate cyclase (GGDEF)-like protein
VSTSTGGRFRAPSRSAAAATTPETPNRRLAVFDALVDAAVIVDDIGAIRDVNAAWETFASLNGGRDEGTGVGVGYLDVCRAGAAAGDEDAAVVAAGLDGVLIGRLRAFEHRYPCPSPIEERWFLVRITAFAEHRGALISHLDVTTSKLAEDRLQYQASHDPLTGLPNREEVLAHLRRAIARLDRTGAPIAVLFLDLDHFKPINDLYGHAAGDRLLVQVGNRLRRQLRANDIVGRIGGDEFLAICDASEAEAVVARLRLAVSHPFQLGADAVVLGVSIGVAVADAQGGADPEEMAVALLSRADQSMYDDKRGRRLAGPDHAADWYPHAS